ncbi:hypothetical protein ScPMuIL_013233 [Solemya velum]
MADEKNLRIPDIIIKKRDGGELTEEEIHHFVNGVVRKDVQDSQLGAMLMAMCLKGLSVAEISTLTRTMMLSGDVMVWPGGWKGAVVDKHSTGGVGDKVSLILAPALAACGLKVPMVSGRGLGHTGGTLDKLESIPGFRSSLNESEMRDVLDKIGCFIIGQSENLVPADKIMYATRDVTGTVDNIGLIAASIMSKKGAENLDALILDVKTGNGAFLKDEKTARTLAETMVATGKCLGIKMKALLTDMNAPLGRMIGNSLEVVESIRCLNGNGPPDLMGLVIHIGGELLSMTGITNHSDSGCRLLEDSIRNGTALAKFREMLTSQGVAPDKAAALCKDDMDWTLILPSSKHTTPVQCESSGTIQQIDAMTCAIVSGNLGAGRMKAGQPINYAVGLELMVHIGTAVVKGDILVKIHHDFEILDSSVITSLRKAFLVKREPTSTQRTNVVIDVIS